ncbi:UNVERIFIED_CONTAM: hypothetical protein GTU68_015430 [Idotea baltica]|nr:hypothetical protein [Idotea baltica]
MRKIYLVGAGPGDPELLTLRAYKLIKKAEVILYDRLVGDEILELAPKDCNLIDVGKKKGISCAEQQELIFELMASYAKRFDNVIRLKGGDPFLLGRGGEEVLAMTKAGVTSFIVPGISSAISVPASIGIPVTHRGVSSSFAVFSGHEAENIQSTGIDWDVASKIPTAIFLMGVKPLKVIIDQLISHGRNPETSIAIIQDGTLKNQSFVSGKLSDIISKSSEIKPPSIIIVGEVVKLLSKVNIGDFNSAEELIFNSEILNNLVLN